MLQHFYLLLGIFILAKSSSSQTELGRRQDGDGDGGDDINGKGDGAEDINGKDDTRGDGGDDGAGNDKEPPPPPRNESATEPVTKRNITPETTAEEQMFTTPETTTTEVTTLTPVSKYGWVVWCKLQPLHYDCNGKGILEQKFSFDVKLGSCVRTLVSSCPNNLNQFKDKKSCNKQCRDFAFKELYSYNSEVRCRLQPEFGSCNNYVPSFYFDVNERTCKGFSYSGCGGNSNRFENMHVCTIYCGNTISYSL